MSKPHLLHLVLDAGLSLRFECQSPGDPACATYYENEAPWPEEPPFPDNAVLAWRGVDRPYFTDPAGTKRPMTDEEAEAWRAYWKAEDERETYVARPDECWVEHHVLECVLNGESVCEFLEDLVGVGDVTGPIPVRVWNEGDFDDCIPRMELWKEPTDEPV